MACVSSAPVYPCLAATVWFARQVGGADIDTVCSCAKLHIFQSQLGALRLPPLLVQNSQGSDRSNNSMEAFRAAHASLRSRGQKPHSTAPAASIAQMAQQAQQVRDPAPHSLSSAGWLDILRVSFHARPPALMPILLGQSSGPPPHGILLHSRLLGCCKTHAV